MANYIGFSADQLLNSVQDRFFYGLRRTDEGELFLGKLDQMSATDSLTINNPGISENDYPYFEEGQDFFEGRTNDHERIYSNLNYEQFKWDDRNLYYYVNDDGELVIKTNQAHRYDENSSSNG